MPGPFRMAFLRLPVVTTRVVVVFNLRCQLGCAGSGRAAAELSSGRVRSGNTGPQLSITTHQPDKVERAADSWTHIAWESSREIRPENSEFPRGSCLRRAGRGQRGVAPSHAIEGTLAREAAGTQPVDEFALGVECIDHHTPSVGEGQRGGDECSCAPIITGDHGSDLIEQASGPPEGVLRRALGAVQDSR